MIRFRNFARMMQPSRQIRATRTEIDVPAELLRARDDLVQALRVGDDLRRVQRVPHVLDERTGSATSEFPSGRADCRRPRPVASSRTTGRGRTRSAIPDTGTPRSNAVWTVQVPVPFIPAASSNDVDEGLPGLCVDVPEDLGGDLDQERVEIAAVPLGEDVGDRGGFQAGAAAQQVVGLGDQLHVGVLDAVVDHLDEVPGPVRADVRAAWHPVHVGGDLLQDRTERAVGLGGSTGHDGRAVQRAFLATGDAAADKVDSLAAQGGFAAAGVWNLAFRPSIRMSPCSRSSASSSITASVGFAGLDLYDDLPRGGEGGHELRRRRRGDEPSLGAVIGDQGGGAGRATVVHGDDEASAREVARQFEPITASPMTPMSAVPITDGTRARPSWGR